MTMNDRTFKFKQCEVASAAASYDSLSFSALRSQAIESLPDGTIARTENFANSISELHRLAKALSRSQEPLVEIKPGNRLDRVVLTALGKKTVEILRGPWESVSLLYIYYQLSPILALFLRLISALPLKHLEAVPSAYDKEVALHLKAKIDRVTDFIRRRLRSPALKAATDNFCRGPRDNFRSLMDGIDWIAQRHRFVVSLRIDLHWDAQSREPLRLGQYPDYAVVDPFMRSRVKFQRYLQRKFGDDLLGVTWTFEHGQRSRFHAHYWILLKPAACSDPLAMVDELGEHWKGIAGSDGRGFFNCHTIRHKHRAIGRVDLHDEIVIVGVRRLSTYFTAAGLYVKLDLGGKHNTFGMTGFPKAPVNKPGPKPKTVPPVLRIPMHVACDQYIGWI